MSARVSVMNREASMVKQIRFHALHVQSEGWIHLFYRIDRVDRPNAEIDYVLILEYVDQNGENRAGNFWAFGSNDLEDVHILMVELNAQVLASPAVIPSSPESPPPPIVPDRNDDFQTEMERLAYRAGYVDGFDDGYIEGRDHSEEDLDGEEWRKPEEPNT